MLAHFLCIFLAMDWPILPIFFMLHYQMFENDDFAFFRYSKASFI